MSSIALNVSKMQRRYVAAVTERLKNLQLGWGQVMYLKVIAENGALTQDEISALTGLDKATTARALAKMEELHYVQRIKDDNDHRKNIVTLTEQGEALCPQVLHHLREASEELFAPLTERERATFVKLLNKILG